MMIRLMSIIIVAVAIPATLTGVLMMFGGDPGSEIRWIGTYLVLAALLALPGLFVLAGRGSMKWKVAFFALGLLVLAGASMGAHQQWLWWSRPNLNRDGGVILTYEIDEQASPPGSYQLDALLDKLRQRLDPTGLSGIEVRSDGLGRIELAIPRAGPKEVDSVKTMLLQQGRLEFLIVANPTDDGPALAAARTYYKEKQDELARREEAYLPPPPPRTVDGNIAFRVALQDEPDHSYQWAKLGKAELANLRLSKEALGGQQDVANEELVEKALADGEPFEMNNALYFVRAITERAGQEARDHRPGKKREFFVLLREPEAGKQVGGEYLKHVGGEWDSISQPAIAFTFNKAGGELFHDLTSRNRPTGPDGAGVRRNLAIVLDGQVMSAPIILSPIRDRGQITGNFTTQEAQAIVRILRAGALPARLRPLPSNEITVGPSR